MKTINSGPYSVCRTLIQTFLGVCVATQIMGGAVFAAEADAEGGLMEEILVTAQRREQTVFEVPASVSVFSQQMLERQNIHSFADYAIRIPSLTFDQVGLIGYRGAVDVTIRGVPGRTNYYLDDTPLPVADVRLFDIERIEVLRGPQGTLYGDASMGGTIKIITNKPSAEGFSGASAASYGITQHGDSSFSAESYVNIPLSERVAMRLTGYYEDVGGYIDNIPASDGLGDQSGGILPFRSNVQKGVNGGDREGVRAALRFEATDSLTIDLSAWAQDLALGARSFYDRTTPLQVSYGGTMFEEQELRVYNATVNWSNGPFNLLSSTTQYANDTINSEDITVFLARGLFGFSPSVFTNAQQLNNAFPSPGFTHETRLSFTGDLGEVPVYAVGGVFYKDSETNRDQYWFDLQAIDDINGAIDPTGALGFDFGNNFDALGVERGLWGFQLLPNKQKQLAFFGEVSATLRPWLELTAGLRWFEFDIHETRTTDGFLFRGFETQSGKTSESDVVPRLNVKAHASENVMLYASATQGFNIGSALGSSLPAICQPALDELGLQDGPINPESLWSYEFGTKLRLFDRRLTIDAAAYRVDWTDIQESVQFPDNSCPESLVGNFGDATINGVEVSFVAFPLDNLEIAGSFGYSDSDRSKPALGSNAAEQVGNTILTTSLMVEYTFPIRDQWDGYIGGDHQYIEEGKEDKPGTPRYHVTNVRLGVMTRDQWEVALVGRNIFNSDPILVTFAPGSIGNLLQQDATLRPRTVSIEARIRY
ncbi:MAG: TonB-dependent receptor [Xanthomonadales bacterium]|nr:TonB-dependent receptor [Xanthomonadales bacterium]